MPRKTSHDSSLHCHNLTLHCTGTPHGTKPHTTLQCDTSCPQSSHDTTVLHLLPTKLTRHYVLTLHYSTLTIHCHTSHHDTSSHNLTPELSNNLSNWRSFAQEPTQAQGQAINLMSRPSPGPIKASRPPKLTAEPQPRPHAEPSHTSRPAQTFTISSGFSAFASCSDFSAFASSSASSAFDSSSASSGASSCSSASFFRNSSLNL